MYAWHFEHRLPRLEVYFLNIAHGSAVFIRTPNGKTALIGGGEGSQVISKITDLIPFYRRHIDTLIESPDPLNNVGLVDVRERYGVGRVVTVADLAGIREESILLDEWENKKVMIDTVGQSSATSSRIIKISFGDSTFLIADSISEKEQRALVKDKGIQNKKAVFNSDVLMLRSAATSRVSDDFFSLVSPAYLIVPKMPARPKTPAKKKFNLYDHQSLKTFSLERDGVVEVISDGGSGKSNLEAKTGN